MFVRFLWMLQTVKYPQRSKLPTFHTLSKVLKLHMSFNTVPILWLEGRAGMVRASWYKDDGEYLRTFGYQKKTRHCSKYAATFACWIESVRTGPIFTTKSKKIKPPSSFKLSGSALKNSTHCLVRVARVELTASWTPFKRATKLRYTRSTGLSRISLIIITDCTENVNRNVRIL